MCRFKPYTIFIEHSSYGVPNMDVKLIRPKSRFCIFIHVVKEFLSPMQPNIPDS